MGGVGGVGGFGPNILSLLVLIEIRIRLKLGCDEIHSIYEKLRYSFYYSSSMVVWLLD